MEAPSVEAFEEHRAHLLRVAYRITGSLADAEDAVQEAWLRWNALDAAAHAELRNERAWLATVVGRVCLDRLRSAARATVERFSWARSATDHQAIYASIAP